MKKLFILFLFFTFDLSSQDCSEFFLIRHAEKDRTNPENKNPNLNEKGNLRALKWAEVFKDLEFDKIYSTDYYRTLETVKPISKKIKKEISIYSPSKINYDKLTLIVKDFLYSNSLKLENISKIYVNRGPGSFAGIRNSLSLVKAFYVSKKIDYYCYSLNDFKGQKDIKYEDIPNLCDKFKIKKNLIKPIYLS